MALSRREALRVGGLGLLGAAGASAIGRVPFGGGLLASEASTLAAADFPVPFTSDLVVPPVLRPAHWEYDDAGRLVRQYYHLTARETTAKILPRLTTRLWTYNGTFPGPTIKVRKGVQTVVRVRNQLPARHPLFGHEFATSTHLHGSASLPQYDGYADDVTPPGFFKDYHYTNHQAARTIWYHDHAVHYTARNVYSGLAAQYHIHDAVERRLLPQGDFDVPLTVTDAMFNADGELAYDDDSQSGLYGDVVLVNGRPWPVMRVQKRVYRFRFLTASVSRSYRFRLSTGDPVHIVATDGGLMPESQAVTQWRQGGAERYEVLIDFRGYRSGQRVVLENLSNDNNQDHEHTGKVLAFDVMDDTFGPGVVDKSDPTWNRIPGQLAPSHVMGLTAASAITSRHLEMGRTGGEWTINGKTWSDVVSSGYQRVLANPDVGDVEVWTIENKSGGWFHPTHIHLVDFQILERNGMPAMAHERGPKDVVYIGENEVVKVVAQFGDPQRPQIRGRYMVHCHNLVHEDHDMMHQFAVGWKPGDPDPADPITADPCKYDDLPAELGVAPARMEAPSVDPRTGEIEVRWKAPDDDGGDPVTEYEIKGFVGGVKRVDTYVGNQDRHRFTDLQPGLTYTFTVTACNRVGDGQQSPHSAPVVFRARKRVPGAPTLRSASATTVGALVTWARPEHDGGAPIQGYEVRVVDADGRRVGPLWTAAASARRLRIKGLRRGVPYRFDVRAVNAVGPGPFSDRSDMVRVPARDNKGPQVVGFAPLANATNVRRRVDIRARFSEDVKGVNTRTVILRREDGGRIWATVTYNEATRRLTLNPRGTLAANTKFTVTLTRGIRDGAGNRLAPVSWSFTTGRRV